MSGKEQKHLENLLQIYERRLNILETQAATFGSFVPPHILIEVEDTREKIKTVQAQLNRTTQPDANQNPEKFFPLKVLFLSSDPTNASRLRLGEEFREIQEKLQLAQLRDRFELHSMMSSRPVDISQALLDVNPNIVHFSGHGTSSGELCFEDQQGKAHPVSPSALASLFKQFIDKVDCVILNACYSEIQAKEIAKHINFVIGMNNTIGDKAAIAFAVGFYQALGAGRSFKESYEFGCVQIQLEGIPEDQTPVIVEHCEE